MTEFLRLKLESLIAQLVKWLYDTYLLIVKDVYLTFFIRIFQDVIHYMVDLAHAVFESLVSIYFHISLLFRVILLEVI